MRRALARAHALRGFVRDEAATISRVALCASGREPIVVAAPEQVLCDPPRVEWDALWGAVVAALSARENPVLVMAGRGLIVWRTADGGVLVAELREPTMVGVAGVAVKQFAAVLEQLAE